MYRHSEPPPPPAGQKNTNTLALISLIAGILGALMSALSLCMWCLGAFSLILGIAAAVLGYLSKKQIDGAGGPQSSRKMASAGMILGLVSIGLSIVFIVLGTVFSGLMLLPEFLSDFF